MTFSASFQRSDRAPWEHAPLLARSSREAWERFHAWRLVKYGVRHYAHPSCLATRHGRNGAKAMIPKHQRRDFDVAMLDASEWDNQLADAADQRRAKEGR